MTEVMEPEAYALPFLDDSCFHRGRTEILLDEERRRKRLPALQTRSGEDEVVLPGVRRLFPPGQKKAGQKGMHRNRSLRSFRLRHLKAPPHVRPPYVHHQILKIQIHPH